MKTDPYIVVAFDSFKESLSSAAANEAAERGIRRAFPDARVRTFVMADGGEGTVEACTANIAGCRCREATVEDILGVPRRVPYAVLADGGAVVESASVIGLGLVPKERRRPVLLRSTALGRLLRAIAEAGCREIYAGLGGSATVDGGIGMLGALGVVFRDTAGARIDVADAGALGRIHSVDLAEIPDSIRGTRFHILADVEAPLTGPRGAARVFAPQKGATAAEVEVLEKEMISYAAALRRSGLPDVETLAGAGAAGGIGGAMASVLDADMGSGSDFVFERADFRAIVAGADLVFTGEGCLDASTLLGKAPIEVLRLSREAGAGRVVALGGACLNPDALVSEGFTAALSVVAAPMSLAEAMQPDVAARNIEAVAGQVARLALG